jgi:hypothetical protein
MDQGAIAIAYLLSSFLLLSRLDGLLLLGILLTINHILCEFTAKIPLGSSRLFYPNLLT